MILSRATLVSISLLFTSLASAVTWNCDHIQADGIKFDLHELGGPHSISVIDKSRPPTVDNTTWTVDICKPLAKLKDVDSAHQCPSGTLICGLVRSYDPSLPEYDPEKELVPSHVIPVAGNFQTSDGKTLDPHYERLKTKDKNAEGLELELGGGTYGDGSGKKKKQKAIIRFECDPDRTGNEGVSDAESKLRRRADDDEDGDKDGNDDKNSLTFVSYGAEDGKGDTDILRLKWKTKYACENTAADAKKGGWGFFTWLIVILFLGTAAYLIFGSWLNYNRYGARGWDLLPHGDSIRDIPYLFKDWSRKVVDTVSGGGSRGGYSAV